MSRRNFTHKTRMARLDLCGHRCEGALDEGKRCNADLRHRRWHADHHNPDGLTGEPTLANCRCLCVPCHAAKTAVDRPQIHQAHRREDRNSGYLRPKAQIKSAGFPRSDRPTRAEKPPLPPRDIYGRGA